jgi:hypothetical protein
VAVFVLTSIGVCTRKQIYSMPPFALSIQEYFRWKGIENSDILLVVETVVIDLHTRR